MRRLLEIIVFTPDMDRMREFYEQRLGLEPGYASPHWTSYKTSGATLALHPLAAGREREMGLTLDSRDLAADVQRLRSRGVRNVGEISRQSYGSYVALKDPDENPITLRQGVSTAEDGGPSISSAILNVRDLDGAVAFYRDHLGLVTALEETGWVEFDAGDANVALHRRASGMNHPLHAGQRIAVCFQAPDVAAWADQIRRRGVKLATAPTDEDFGVYAEVMDPDGNVVVWRQPRVAPSLEEELAEAFDEDEVTHPVGIRRPVKKGAKATSFVAVKPEYKTRHVAKNAPVHHGPDKAPSDAQRARSKPPEGHRRKTETVRATRQKTAVARASKGKPVKRGAARPASRKPKARGKR